MADLAQPPAEAARVGLCATCAHARVIENRHGSRFYRCGRSDVDPVFPRYPRLPVIACSGHELAAEHAKAPPRVPSADDDQ